MTTKKVGTVKVKYKVSMTRGDLRKEIVTSAFSGSQAKRFAMFRHPGYKVSEVVKE